MSRPFLSMIEESGPLGFKSVNSGFPNVFNTEEMPARLLFSSWIKMIKSLQKNCLKGQLTQKSSRPYFKCLFSFACCVRRRRTRPNFVGVL